MTSRGSFATGARDDAPPPKGRIETGGAGAGHLLKGKVVTGWRNTSAIGEPPHFVATDWRDPLPHERRRAKAGPEQVTPTPVTVPFAPMTSRAQAATRAKVRWSSQGKLL